MNAPDILRKLSDRLRGRGAAPPPPPPTPARVAVQYPWPAGVPVQADEVRRNGRQTAGWQERRMISQALAPVGLGGYRQDAALTCLQYIRAVLCPMRRPAKRDVEQLTVSLPNLADELAGGLAHRHDLDVADREALRSRIYGALLDMVMARNPRSLQHVPFLLVDAPLWGRPQCN